MSVTETRKRLLIAESEVHRARVLQEAVEWGEAAGGVVRRVTAAGAVASAVVVAGAGWMAVRRRKAAGGKDRANWLQPALQTIGMISTVWMAWRSRRKDDSDEAPSPVRARADESS